MARTIVQIDTRQIVYSTNAPGPILNILADENRVTPWSWDERIWTSKDYENTDISLAILDTGEASRIPFTYWQSGVGSILSDLKFMRPIKIYRDGTAQWSAQIRKGTYYKYKYWRYMFPDRSYIQQVDYSENVSGRNVLALDKTPLLGGQIVGIMWQRDTNGNPQIFRHIRKKLSFSGIYDRDGMRQTVDGDGNILWGNVDFTKSEFVVDWSTEPPVLYFNKDYTFLIGLSHMTSDDQLEMCEYLGDVSDEEYQVFVTDYFPISDNAELVLYAGALTEVLVKDTDYAIDLDRGEIALLTPVVSGTPLYLRYRPTVEVEYEPENCNEYQTALDLEMNPIRSQTARGIVHLTEKDRQLAYLLLTCDAEEITTGIYGPLTVGADYCILTATAYNISGQTISNLKVVFYLDPAADLGTINGSTGEVPTYTDANGEARVVYVPPRSASALGQYLYHLPADPPEQLRLAYTSGIQLSSLDSLYTFVVDGDDSSQPWVDTWGSLEPGSGGRKIVLYQWDTSAIHPFTGELGAYTPVRPIGLNTIGSDVYLVYPDNLPYVAPSLTAKAYWVAGTRHAIPHVKAYSNLYQTWITERQGLELRLELPEYMKGSYVAGGIETPYGWRLGDDNSDTGAGLDSTTYLSINPLASATLPIMWAGIATGSYQIDPFVNGRLGLSFTVIL